MPPAHVTWARRALGLCATGHRGCWHAEARASGLGPRGAARSDAFIAFHFRVHHHHHLSAHPPVLALAQPSELRPVCPCDSATTRHSFSGARGEAIALEPLAAAVPDTPQPSEPNRFSRTLASNSVPAWRTQYLDYSQLKILVHGLAEGRGAPHAPLYPPVPNAGHSYSDRPDNVDIESESAALLSAASEEDESSPDRIFVAALDQQVKKICSFYRQQQEVHFTQVAQLTDEVAAAEGAAQATSSAPSGNSTEALIDIGHALDQMPDTASSPHTPSPSPLPPIPESSSSFDTGTPAPQFDKDAPEPTGLLRRSESTRGDGPAEAGARSGLAFWSSEDDRVMDLGLAFKRRAAAMFVSLSELQQYVSLNRMGLKKILKKYDTALGHSLKDAYLNKVVNKQPPFTSAAHETLIQHINRVVDLYSRVHTQGQQGVALQQLKLYLREEALCRQEGARQHGSEHPAEWREESFNESRGELGRVEPEQQLLPRHRDSRSAWLSMSALQLSVALTVFIALLKMPMLRFFDRIESQNCLAMLALCTILWATEVIPLFVTSFLVPFLVVTLRVARSDDGKDRRLGADETAKWIFLQMFAPNMCLLIGGFALAAALSKYGIDKVLAVKVLGLAGTKPSRVLLAHMAVATFASMWVSNVAAPVLMYGLIQPILDTLPSGSPYARSLILGIALASNIGGQTSPIASPQNLIALQYMKEPLGWLQWFAITIPVSGLCVVAIWFLMLRVYGSGDGVVIRRVTSPAEPFTRAQWFITGISVATILLWCVERNFDYILGDMGVVALIPIIVFFGTGLLTKDDFNNFLWTVVFLAMGGIALGKAVTASGLLGSLDLRTLLPTFYFAQLTGSGPCVCAVIQDIVQHMSLWQVLLSLLSISLVVATFISHTIATVLLAPIAAQVGDKLDVPHPRLLIMATTLAASAAMGLPVSGFPNMTAASLEDRDGRRYLTVRDFLRSGLLASALCGAIIATVGVLVMTALGL